MSALYLWQLLGLVLLTISWWIAQGEFRQWLNKYRQLPPQVAYALTGLAALGILLSLRGFTSLAFSEGTQIPSILAHWLLGAIVLVIVERWPHVF